MGEGGYEEVLAERRTYGGGRGEGGGSEEQQVKGVGEGQQAGERSGGEKRWSR